MKRLVISPAAGLVLARPAMMSGHSRSCRPSAGVPAS